MLKFTKTVEKSQHNRFGQLFLFLFYPCCCYIPQSRLFRSWLQSPSCLLSTVLVSFIFLCCVISESPTASDSRWRCNSFILTCWNWLWECNIHLRSPLDKLLCRKWSFNTATIIKPLGSLIDTNTNTPSAYHDIVFLRVSCVHLRESLFSISASLGFLYASMLTRAEEWRPPYRLAVSGRGAAHQGESNLAAMLHLPLAFVNLRALLNASHFLNVICGLTLCN